VLVFFDFGLWYFTERFQKALLVELNRPIPVLQTQQLGMSDKAREFELLRHCSGMWVSALGQKRKFFDSRITHFHLSNFLTLNKDKLSLFDNIITI
jgi:hypothetical protein